MSIEIRKYKEENAKDIALLEKICFSEPWSENAVRDFLSYDYNTCVIAYENDVFAGYITYTSIAEEFQIANIAVMPEMRKKGIAQRMLEELFYRLEKVGGTQIFLEVRKSNAPAIALYEKNGFVKTGERKKFYTNPQEDAILYNYRLIENCNIICQI